MIRAKFQCWSIDAQENGELVQLSAVATSDPADPNHSWSQATPSGNLSMYISNPAARGKFEQGKEYYLDLTPVSTAADGSATQG